MLSKSKRVTTPLFKEIVSKGTPFYSDSFSLRVLKGDPSRSSRFSVTVSKKIAKRAVDRNKIRRRLYAVVGKIYPALKKGYSGVLFAKHAVLTKKMTDLAKEADTLFSKVGVKE